MALRANTEPWQDKEQGEGYAEEGYAEEGYAGRTGHRSHTATTTFDNISNERDADDPVPVQ